MNTNPIVWLRPVNHSDDESSDSDIQVHASYCHAAVGDTIAVLNELLPQSLRAGHRHRLGAVTAREWAPGGPSAVLADGSRRTPYLIITVRFID